MRGLPWMIGVGSACWCGEPPAADTAPIEPASSPATPSPATPPPATTITVPAGVYPVPDGEVWVAGFRLGLPALPRVACPLPSPEERWIAQSFDPAPGQPGYEELASWPDCRVCQAAVEAAGVWGFSLYYGGGGDPGGAERTAGSDTIGLWSLFVDAGEPPAPLHARCITRNESTPREAWVSATQVPLQARRGAHPPDRDDAPPTIPLRTGARVDVLYSDGRWAWVRHDRRWFDLDGQDLGVFHCEPTGWVPVDALTFGVPPINAWIDAAEAALSEGRARDAVSAARRAVRAAPHDVAALTTLGAAEEASGAQDPSAAEDASELLIDPAVGVRRVLARLPSWFDQSGVVGVSLRSPCAQPDGVIGECTTPSPAEGAAAVAVAACDDVPLRLRVAFEGPDEPLAGSVHVRARPVGAADSAWRTLVVRDRLPRSEVVTWELPASRWSTPALEVTVDAVVGFAKQASSGQHPIRTRRWTLQRTCDGEGDVEPSVSPEASAPSAAPGSSPAPPVSPAPTPAATGEAPAPAANGEAPAPAAPVP